MFILKTHTNIITRITVKIMATAIARSIVVMMFCCICGPVVLEIMGVPFCCIGVNSYHCIVQSWAREDEVTQLPMTLRL